jgi:hypothetical protein
MTVEIKADPEYPIQSQDIPKLYLEDFRDYSKDSAFLDLMEFKYAEILYQSKSANKEWDSLISAILFQLKEKNKENILSW